MGLKFALRQLLKSPGFAAVAILTLALGIGANAAIFSFINSWILRPSAFPDLDQLVVMFETDKKSGSNSGHGARRLEGLAGEIGDLRGAGRG